MYAIIGLGNPGKEYALTRHNAGFLALDDLQASHHLPTFTEEKKLSALVSKGQLFGQSVLLVKPTTFMNLSGKAVQAVLSFYKIPTNHLVVLHDEVDIASGTLRTTLSSRSAGNNGVQSIIDTLGTQDFFRLRLGVGRPADTVGACMPTHDYVLKDFTEAELTAQKTLLPEIEQALKEFLT